MHKLNMKIVVIGLMLPIIILLTQIGWLEHQLAETEVVRLRAVGYDPRSLLSGHYLQVEIDWSRTDCRQFQDNQCPKERFKQHYRYYVPEKDAKVLEDKIRSGQHDVELEFTYPKKGAPQILNLLLDGKNWYDTQNND